MDLKERIQGLLRTSDTRARKSPIAASAGSIRHDGRTRSVAFCRDAIPSRTAENAREVRPAIESRPQLDGNPRYQSSTQRSGVPLTVPDAVRQTTIPLRGVGAEIHLPEVTLAVAR